jgi:hypothetical protein
MGGCPSAPVKFKIYEVDSIVEHLFINCLKKLEEVMVARDYNGYRAFRARVYCQVKGVLNLGVGTGKYYYFTHKSFVTGLFAKKHTHQFHIALLGALNAGGQVKMVFS